MKRVFISRAQEKDSAFKKCLEERELAVVGQSLVSFLPAPVTSIPSTDWIFFYSKNGVRFFLEALAALEISLPEGLRFGAIGSGTAQLLEAQGFPVDFIGTGEPKTTAEAFLPLAKGKRVLFPQAAHSKQSIQKRLSGLIIVIPLIVYQNNPLGHFDLPYCDVLVFTSPINAKAYFNRYKLKESQKVIAIGNTTASSLQSLGVPEISISEEPSEEGLIAAVLTILNL